MLFGGGIAAGGRDQSERFGWFGRMDPATAERFGVDIPVWFFEMDGDLLLRRAGRTPRFRPLPRYPAARRDLAFIVDEKVRSAELEVVLMRHGGELLEEVELFDLFTGGPVPPGKKSLAYHLTFRSPARTLLDAEIDVIIERLVDEMRRGVGAELRTI